MSMYAPVCTRRAFAAGLLCVPLAYGTAASAAGDARYMRILDRYFNAGHFDGIVLVARGDRTLYRGAIGLANRERPLAHDVDERFRIASVTKQFTALLVMQEVERGSIDLDAPISAYLPALPREVAAITTRQLLKNTSGLPNLDAIPNAYTRDGTFDDLPAYVKTLPLVPLVNAPGTKFSYNNLDFLIAGAILQSVTARPFAVLVRERITDKLGMRSTGVYGSTIPDSDVKGYELSGTTLVPEKIGRLQNFGPAGAMYSTLEDMRLWDRALFHGRLLGRDALREMFTADKAFGYVALGSWAYDLGVAGRAQKVHCVERQGNIGGIQILNLIAPDQDIALIVMANTDYADLFNTYSGRGLPYDLLAEALREA